MGRGQRPKEEGHPLYPPDPHQPVGPESKRCLGGPRPGALSCWQEGIQPGQGLRVLSQQQVLHPRYCVYPARVPEPPCGVLVLGTRTRGHRGPQGELPPIQGVATRWHHGFTQALVWGGPLSGCLGQDCTPHLHQLVHQEIGEPRGRPAMSGVREGPLGWGARAMCGVPSWMAGVHLNSVDTSSYSSRRGGPWGFGGIYVSPTPPPGQGPLPPETTPTLRWACQPALLRRESKTPAYSEAGARCTGKHLSGASSGKSEAGALQPSPCLAGRG